MSPSEGSFGRDQLRRLGGQIRLLRERSAMSRSQLAAASGLSARSIREIESGRSSPSLATAVALAKALGTTIDELVDAARRWVPVQLTAGAAAEGKQHVDLSAALPRAEMHGTLIRLSPDSMLPPTEDDGALSSFCFVLDGRVSVSLCNGEIVRLHKGDSYHSAPGHVRGLSAAGSAPARLLRVYAPASGGAECHPRSLEQADAGGS